MKRLVFKIFNNCPELRYGISSRSDGPMETASALGRQTNRKAYFRKIRLGRAKTLIAGLRHSSSVKFVNGQSPQMVKNCDALLAQTPGLTLTVTVADCLPVYFYDPKLKICGLAHSGWRGTKGGIVPAVIGQMQKRGSLLKNILVGIGPGIGPCHFEIKQGIANKFSKYRGCLIKKQGKMFANLPKIVKIQALKAGLSPKNFEDCRLCTYCLKQSFFSFRRDKPNKLQAMLAYISVN